MNDKIQLISDGDSLMVVGEKSAVARFLDDEGIQSKALQQNRLRPLLSTASAAFDSASQVSEMSGRWVRLTAESAEKIKKYGLMDTDTPRIKWAMIGKPGEIRNWLEIDKGFRSLANPALLSGLAGFMAQQALQQTMDEITSYLARIDEKVDDVLRAQKDAVFADVIGVEIMIDESMALFEQIGRISDVTWSKVQGAPTTIARTQSYALRQLEGLASKLEAKSQIGDIADAAQETQKNVREWLAVLARCFQLRDAFDILELDRVSDSAPEEVDRHRIALRTAREERLDRITQATQNLLERMDAAAHRANSRVLLNPVASPQVVKARNDVANKIERFYEPLGITSRQEDLGALAWRTAAAEVRDKAIAKGADGIDAAKRIGGVTIDRATEPFRSVDRDGDGIPDRPRVLDVAEGAGSAIRSATSGATEAVSFLFRRKKDTPRLIEIGEGDLEEPPPEQD